MSPTLFFTFQTPFCSGKLSLVIIANYFNPPCFWTLLEVDISLLSDLCSTFAFCYCCLPRCLLWTRERIPEFSFLPSCTWQILRIYSLINVQDVGVSMECVWQEGPKSNRISWEFPNSKWPRLKSSLLCFFFYSSYISEPTWCTDLPLERVQDYHSSGVCTKMAWDG